MLDLARIITLVLFAILLLSAPSFGLLSSQPKVVSVATLKDRIIQEAKGTANGVTANAEKKAVVMNLVKQLETKNRVKKLSMAPALDGNWNLIFTTNDGSSAGKLGPFVGKVRQDIVLSEKKYTNYVFLGPVTGALTATWENLDDKKWKVIFIDIVLTLFGVPLIKKQFPADQTGIWRMTYTDENFRVLYAQGGKNKKLENIYILSKATPI